MSPRSDRGGRPWRLAIVGWPVDHSLSPPLWEAMAGERGVELEYARCPVEPEDAEAWDAVWSSELDGFNVTAPWKERAAERCDALSPAAERIGAVNTVVRRDAAWEGHTTDGYGLVRSVLAAGHPLRERRVAVLGTGGAGRAVARATADAGAETTLITRHPDRIPEGCEDLARIDWDALADVDAFEILVNATPLGGEESPPVPPRHAGAGTLVVDLHYVPPVTALLRRARAGGAETLNGFGMLIHQACLGAAIALDDDPAGAEEYETAFWAAARSLSDRSLEPWEGE